MQNTPQNIVPVTDKTCMSVTSLLPLNLPALTKLPATLWAVLFTTLLALALTTPAQAATATRASSFAYDPVSGLLTKEIIEPGDAQLCLVTEYAYDAFGNRTAATVRNCNGSAGEAAAPVSGGDAVIAPRTTGTTYDNRGQFPLTATNALGHTETRSFDPRFGTALSLTGPNHLTTTWAYDTFGRKTAEARADGTTTHWTYILGTCTLASAVSTGSAWCTVTTQSGTVNPAYTYFDTLNRTILTSHRNFANTDWIDDNRTTYDNLGRVAQSYSPYERAAIGSAKYSTASYDILGRVTTSTAPDGSQTNQSYNGLTTTVTNSLNQTRTTLKNSQGQTVTVTDAQNKTLSYRYDPFGNLTQTIDTLGNTTVLSYDARGRKTGMNDPDTGIWSYAYNALGEFIRQTDAKGQTTTLAYDQLGRMTSRAEPDLNSTWTYDTAAYGIGKLAVAAADNGYSRTHSYDTLGRPTTVSTTIDDPAAPYITNTTYDTFGRPAVQVYASGLAIQNIYNADGYLTQIVNYVTSAVYWTANSLDAQGRVLQQTYGNGITTNQVFDANTGRLTSQLAGPANAVQNMTYAYDSLGNVTTRQDNTGNLSESYTYDNLNRLTNATATSGTINTLTSLAYDAIGNITSKSDVGAYSYNVSGAGSIHPHALSQITGTVNGLTNPTYNYDPNGNLTTGAGRSITWTSYNLPGNITRGSESDTFWYNTEHERTKELHADGTNLVTLSPRYDIGLHFVKTTQPDGVVKYEHFLYAGNIQFAQVELYATTNDPTTFTQTKVRYFHKDAISSIVAITDESGAVLERLSYDPFGKRRSPNGAADPNGLLTSQITEHGFTSQEQLDNVGLIHLNGRIYDPLTGRFLSADPYIQDPLNLQSYNRYSYCLNDPVGCTDPSGYFSLGGLFDGIGSALAGVWHDFSGGSIGKVALGVAAFNIGGPATFGLLATTPYVEDKFRHSAFLREVGAIVASSFGPLGDAYYAAYMSKIYGGSAEEIIKSAFLAYVSSSAFKYVDGQKTWSDGTKVVAHAAIGGASTAAQGGSFADGFKYAGLSAGASETYKYVVRYAANPLPGAAAVDKSDPLSPPVEGVNNVGEVSPFATTNPCFLCEGGPVSRFANEIPGINAVAGFHDQIQNFFLRNGGQVINAITNVPTMFLAAGLTYTALLQGQPSVQLAIGR